MWTDPWDSGLALAGDHVLRGEALVAVPITLRRPPPSETINVPPPWLKFIAVDGPDGTTLTSAYSNERREWVDGLSRQTRISLRFELPAVLLPLEITTARLAATIHAPGRDVMVAGWRGGQRVAVATHRSPVRQQLTMQIDDPSILSLDDQGGLILNLDVAPHPDEKTAGESRTAWRISDVYLSCTAVVRPVDAAGLRDDL